MQISKITFLSILALASSAMADPAPIENFERSTEVSQDVHVHQKRFGPIAILLVKVIGGQLVAGAAKAAVDVAKAHLEPEGSKFKDFDAARTAFTKEMVLDLWNHKNPSNVKGIACFNGPYSFSSGSKYEGPINIKFKWDVYNTDYDCFEMISGTVTNRGDGGYINVAYYGTCTFTGKDYRC